MINCAAYTAVDLAEKEKERAFEVNALGPENLAKVAKERGFSLIHLSTNYIFDGKRDLPYNENDRANPLGVYGASKWEGEKRVLDLYPSACVVRTSWLFGNGGKNFVSSLLHTLKTEKVVQAAVDQTGRITYARDLAEAILFLLPAKGVFHFANRGALSRYEIACRVKEAAEKKGVLIKTEEIIPVEVRVFSSPAPRPDRAVLATDKIEERFAIRAWQPAFEEYLNEIG
jgi:dTDP-4-dehydrorhamnose reductase